MKKTLLFLFVILVSVASFAQSPPIPDLNVAKYTTDFPGIIKFVRDSAHVDTRPTYFMVQDQYGRKWLDSLRSAGYWNAKLDSVFTSGDTLYQYVKGVRTFRGVIQLTGGAPGGAVNSVQFQQSSSVFGGITNATTNGTDIFSPTWFNGTASGGNGYVSGTTNATKGKYYFGFKSNYFDEANSVWHFNKSALTNTATVGFSLEDTTVTTSGVSQNAPIFEMVGRAFGTTGGTDQIVKYQMFMQTVASAVPSGSFTLRSQINGGSFINCFVTDISGNTTLAGTLTVGGNQINNSSAGAILTFSATGTNILTGSAALQLFVRTHNLFASLNETGSFFTDSIANPQTLTSGMLFQLKSSTKFFGLPSNNTLQLNAIATKPTGGMMYDNAINKIKFYDGTIYRTLLDSATAAALYGGSSPPFADNTNIIKNSSDPTKLIQFSAANISTTTVRTVTFPDANINVPGTNIANSFTALQTFTTGAAAQGLLNLSTNRTGPPISSTGVALNLDNFTFTDNTTSGTFTQIIASARLKQVTMAATNASTIYSASAIATLYIDGPPIAGTNVTINSPYSVYVATGDVAFLGNIKGSTSSVLKYGAISGISSTPSIVAGTGAGTSPSVSVTGTNIGGDVTVTTGTAPTGAGATVATITYANSLTFPTGSTVILTPGNAATAALNGISMVFTTGSTTTFVITAGTTALAGSTAFIWHYQVAGY